MSVPLFDALHQLSPRFTKPATPFPSLLIHGSVAALWLFLLGFAFVGHGISKWWVGIIYILYDTLLVLFTFVQSYPLRHPQPNNTLPGQRPSLTVVVATYNEVSRLEKTIKALRQQSETPEQIIIADDGSIDGTTDLLIKVFDLPSLALGEISRSAPLRWLRAPHQGKAMTLNAALPHIETDLFVTVDADTVLDKDALKAMRDGFQEHRGLVAATGVLSPSCRPTFMGQCLEWFQTYEYIRNFLGRYAWDQMDSLLLISGAFAGFRTEAVINVGGFDPDCIVEDYELIHRLRRYGYDRNLDWHSAVLGKAHARTSAPSTLLSFLRQRRRWFGGFLQTQYWYRDMVGASRYRRLGTMMLPVKAMDTFQPIYGLCAFFILVWYVVTGKFTLIIPILFIMLSKIILDLGFHLWSIKLYRNWVSGPSKAHLAYAVCATFLEPFSFQLLRHLGACWGWLLFLTGELRWEKNPHFVAPIHKSEAPVDTK